MSERTRGWRVGLLAAWGAACAHALAQTAPAMPPVPPVPPIPLAPTAPPMPGGLPASAAPAAPAAPPGPAAEGRLYTPGSFDALEITGTANVRLQQGAADQVFVEGDEAAQKSVALELRDGRLEIRPAGTWKFWIANRTQLLVTMRDLKRVHVSGAADVHAGGPMQLGALAVHISGAGQARFDQLKADQLRFSVSGAGNGQMAGTVGELTVTISGRGDFRGEDLMAQRARVQVSGLGDVRVWATQDLTIGVSGIGSVSYWGGATVRRQTSGVATITDRGPKAPRP